MQKKKVTTVGFFAKKQSLLGDFRDRIYLKVHIDRQCSNKNL